MPVENKAGLSKAQIEKIQKPYAHNTGPKVDYDLARKGLEDFDRENADLWKDVTRLLSRSQG